MSDFNSHYHHPFQFGVRYKKAMGRLFVAVNGGTLILGKVLLNNVDITEKVKVGDRFYTLGSELEASKNSRIIYTAKGLKK